VQLALPFFVIAAALLSMVFMGVSQRLVDWKPSRTCRFCGRDRHRDCRCRCRSRLR
jgi:hypothetical protein